MTVQEICGSKPYTLQCQTQHTDPSDLSAATCPLSAATCPLSAATCPVSAATCPVSAATRPVSAATRPLSAVGSQAAREQGGALNCFWALLTILT
jgi:hypothetical protein